MKFKETIGGDAVKNQLIQQVQNNRISHSQMFVGPKGSSKLSFAFAFAQYINCTNKTEKDSCGDCDSCIKHTSLTHPDLHLIFPVLSTQKIKNAVSDNFVLKWREKVLKNPYLNIDIWLNVFKDSNKTGKPGYIYKQESDLIHKKLSLKHYESEFRTVIMWLPEKMQRTTSNKILKLIEEPPKKTVFILVSRNPEQLISTITSRLQITKFKPHSKLEIESFLSRKKFKKNKDQINEIINRSNGNLGESLEFLQEENGAVADFENFSQWMRMCYSANLQETAQWVNKIHSLGRISQLLFLKYSLKMIRNCLVFHSYNIESLYITEQERGFLLRFYKFVNEKNIVGIRKKIEDSAMYIERNANSKIIFYELSLEMMKQLKVNRKFVKKNN